MNTEINQKISQLLDNELHHSEQLNLLNEINQQPELTNKMNRYQAVSQVLKTDDFVITKANFLEKINMELEKEPSYFLPQQKIKKQPVRMWQKTSLAVAASVAIIAVISTQRTEILSSDGKQMIAQVEQIQPNQAKDQVPTKTQIAQHERFKAYLQAHSDDLYKHGTINYQPQARVANFGQE